MATQYNIVGYGTLTNTNGVLSNFSTSNYATIPLTFNPTQKPYEIVFKVNTETMPTNAEGIIWQTGDVSSARGRLDFEVWEDKLYAEYAANNGMVWYMSGITTLTPNTNYWVKFSYNGIDTYGLYLSTDGSTWSTEGTVTSDRFLTDGFSADNIIGVQREAGGMIIPWFGSIDLNGSYIDINNLRWWQGVTSISNVQTRIQLRHDTASNWTSVNPVLLEGEVGIETDTRKQKFGDGSTAWNSLTYDAGSTALQSITNSDIITALGYTPQTQLVSGTNIKSINNTSLLGSGNINVLQNTATGINALTISGIKNTNYHSSVNIGSNSTVGADYSLALGAGAKANGNRSIAIGSDFTQGNEAIASAGSSIQIGRGTNSTAFSLQVDSYQLLDTTTGLIPDARLSINIARTSNVADSTLSNVSSIDSNSAVQTALDDKVSKSGDTMTGGLTIENASFIAKSSNIDFSTTPSTNVYFRGNIIRDVNNNDVAFIESGHLTTNAQRASLVMYSPTLNTYANINVGFNANGDKYCDFPNTTCVNGQWVPTNVSIAAEVSLNGSTDLSYTVNVPNDGYEYEAMIVFWGTTGSTNGNSIEIQVNSNKLTQRLNICRAITRTSSTATCSGSIILPLTTDRTMYVRRATGFNGTFTAQLKGYRRMGTNS